MNLRYRGIEYEYTPSICMFTKGEVGGKYRGLDWRFRNLEKPPVLQPRLNLTYRGIKYSNQPVFNPAERPEVKSVEERIRWLAINQEKATRKRNERMLRCAVDKVCSI